MAARARWSLLMHGLLLALAAYGIWGCFPLFFSLLNGVAPFEVLAHRIVWAFGFTAVVIALTARGRQWRRVLSDLQRLKWLGVSSLFIGVNWLVFIWAVSNRMVLEASLGYFITPLVSLWLGHWLLREPLSAEQAVAGLLAAGAVLFELVAIGRLPWVTLVLAFSFGFYGLVRKRQPVDSVIGLNIESLTMGVPSLLFLVWWAGRGDPAFATDFRTTALLIAAGPVTAIPLVLFAAATARLNLSVVGFVMYLNPTMQFLTAVFILHEPFPPQRWITCVIIWVAMVLFMWGMRRGSKKLRPVAVQNAKR